MFQKNIFCERLKSLRQDNNLTLEKLGYKLNVTKVTTSRWETGNRLPTIESLYDLADIFGVSIDYLVGRSDNPNRY